MDIVGGGGGTPIFVGLTFQILIFIYTIHNSAPVQGLIPLIYPIVTNGIHTHIYIYIDIRVKQEAVGIDNAAW